MIKIGISILIVGIILVSGCIHSTEKSKDASEIILTKEDVESAGFSVIEESVKGLTTVEDIAQKEDVSVEEIEAVLGCPLPVSGVSSCFFIEEGTLHEVSACDITCQIRIFGTEEKAKKYYSSEIQDYKEILSNPHFGDESVIEKITFADVIAYGTIFRIDETIVEMMVSTGKKTTPNDLTKLARIVENKIGTGG